MSPVARKVRLERERERERAREVTIEREAMQPGEAVLQCNNSQEMEATSENGSFAQYDLMLMPCHRVLVELLCCSSCCCCCCCCCWAVLSIAADIAAAFCQLLEIFANRSQLVHMVFYVLEGTKHRIGRIASLVAPSSHCISSRFTWPSIVRHPSCRHATHYTTRRCGRSTCGAGVRTTSWTGRGRWCGGRRACRRT